jgi:hypothetical protein
MTDRPAPRPKAAPEWATEFRDRSPRFKVHNTLGHAHSAFRNGSRYREARKGLLLHWTGEEWSVVLDTTEGLPYNELPWRKK